MGDIADWINDSFAEDEFGDDSGVTCKFCQQDLLEWCQARGANNKKRWVLVDDDGTIHECRSLAHPMEFPDLTKNSSSLRKPGRRPGNGSERRIRRA